MTPDRFKPDAIRPAPPSSDLAEKARRIRTEGYKAFVKSDGIWCPPNIIAVTDDVVFYLPEQRRRFQAKRNETESRLYRVEDVYRERMTLTKYISELMASDDEAIKRSSPEHFSVVVFSDASLEERNTLNYLLRKEDGIQIIYSLTKTEDPQRLVIDVPGKDGYNHRSFCLLFYQREEIPEAYRRPGWYRLFRKIKD